jgi:hypothetical protein
MRPKGLITLQIGSPGRTPMRTLSTQFTSPFIRVRISTTIIVKPENHCIVGSNESLRTLGSILSRKTFLVSFLWWGVTAQTLREFRWPRPKTGYLSFRRLNNWRRSFLRICVHKVSKIETLRERNRTAPNSITWTDSVSPILALSKFPGEILRVSFSIR